MYSPKPNPKLWPCWFTQLMSVRAYTCRQHYQQTRALLAPHWKDLWCSSAIAIHFSTVTVQCWDPSKNWFRAYIVQSRIVTTSLNSTPWSTLNDISQRYLGAIAHVAGDLVPCCQVLFHWWSCTRNEKFHSGEMLPLGVPYHRRFDTRGYKI